MKRPRNTWISVGMAVAACGLSFGLAMPQASAEPASTTAVSGVVGGHVHVTREAILKWWTPARMAAAKNVTVITAKAPVKQEAVGQGMTYGTPGQVPGGPPSHSAGLASRSALPHIAASFTYPFPYDSWNVPKASYSKYPYSVNGKIFFRNDGATYVCSGTVVPSESGSSNEDEVWTAGHCLSNTESLTKVVDTSLEFVPGWYKSKKDEEPFGVFTWNGGWQTATAWLDKRDLSVDEAAFTVNKNTAGETLGTVTGWAGFAWNYSTAEQFEAFGYPSQSPYNGNNMIIDLGASAVLTTGVGGSGKPPIGIGNPMTKGSSGGAWDVGWTTTGAGDVNGHNDYKYTTQPLAMYSPYQTTLSNKVRCFGKSSC
jgi:hypothetical protein